VNVAAYRRTRPVRRPGEGEVGETGESRVGTRTLLRDRQDVELAGWGGVTRRAGRVHVRCSRALAGSGEHERSEATGRSFSDSETGRFRIQETPLVVDELLIRHKETDAVPTTFRALRSGKRGRWHGARGLRWLNLAWNC